MLQGEHASEGNLHFDGNEFEGGRPASLRLERNYHATNDLKTLWLGFDNPATKKKKKKRERNEEMPK